MSHPASLSADVDRQRQQSESGHKRQYAGAGEGGFARQEGGFGGRERESAREWGERERERDTQTHTQKIRRKKRREKRCKWGVGVGREVKLAAGKGRGAHRAVYHKVDHIGHGRRLLEERLDPAVDPSCPDRDVVRPLGAGAGRIPDDAVVGGQAGRGRVGLGSSRGSGGGLAATSPGDQKIVDGLRYTLGTERYPTSSSKWRE